MNNIFINTSYIKTQPNPFQGRQIEAIQKSSFIDLKQWIQDRIDDGSIIAGGGGGASLPSQSGNAGKFLTTNGTTASWATVNSAVWGNITGTLSAQTDLQSALDLKAPLASPTFTGTVSGITKSMVGLGNVDNTSDANKPVSTATQTALDLKANLASPTFTGTVVLPSTTSIGSVTNTELSYISGVTSSIQTQLNAKLNSASFVPAGSNTQLQFNNSGAFGASANLTWNGTTLGVTGNQTITPSANTVPLTVSGYSLTSNNTQSLLDLSGTWNTTGTPTAIKLNITDTQSNSQSKLFDLQVNGNSVFKVIKNGSVNLGYSSVGPQIFTVSSGIGNVDNNGGALSFYNNWSTINSATLGAVNFGGANFTATTGTQIGFNIAHTFAPTSGTAVFNATTITSTINQTGGANGITRGLYINPTLSAAADFRPLEISLAGAVGSSTMLAQFTTVAKGANTNSFLRIGGGVLGSGAFFDLNVDTNTPAFEFRYGNNNNNNINSGIPFKVTYDGRATLAQNINVTGNSGLSSGPGPSGLWTGTWITGGTSTTTKPHVLIEPTSTTSTNWSTSGTGLGVNAASGFAGNLIDLQLNGSSKFSVTSTGNASSSANFTALGGIAAYSTIEGYNTGQSASFSGNVRVGAGSTNNASAVLDVVSTTRGFLPPRMNTTSKNAISSPAAGLIVYDTTLNKLCVYTGSAWETITSA